VGYCQAQAPIAAILLMHLPPEQAFWVFVQINEEYVKGYFSDGLMAVKEDALATELLIQKVSSRGHRLLVSSYFVSKNKMDSSRNKSTIIC
jgi:hypothetical protein